MVTTERLVLRRMTVADAPDVERLINVREVALNTLRIPFPYPPGEAARWIASHSANDHVFALRRRDDEQFVGCVGLHVQPDHGYAELGYWIGVPFWGHGYATEAASAVVRFGFDDCELHKIFAHVFKRNAASARVLQKIGMRYEGTLREHFRKWGEFVDADCYGMLRSDFDDQSLRA